MANASETLPIPGVLLIRPRRFGDHRGWFMETYVRDRYRELGVEADFVQDNQSMSAKAGTLRGLHFQRPPFAQAKLVRAVRGSIYDVAVDLRRGSPHYGQWCGQTLTADGGEQLFVPRGFAHGFVTLEPDTEVAYKVDAVYDAASDGGVRWDDPAIGVDWPWPKSDITLSPKDAELPLLASFETPFSMG